MASETITQEGRKLVYHHGYFEVITTRYLRRYLKEMKERKIEMENTGIIRKIKARDQHNKNE